MRALIIEDQRKISRLLREGMSQHGFTVDICEDHAAGLAHAQAYTYDIIILDRMLPGGWDGIDICRSLRRSQVTTPIIFLTAKDQLDDKVAGLDSGADDYLIKPFSFEELIARCRALIRRGATATSDILCADDLEMNVAARTVYRAGQPITLSSKEYSILEYLLRNQGRVLSKQQIIANIWDQDSDVLASTVEVFIVYLRKKIDQPFGKQLIKTVRGFGYTIGESS